MTNGPWKKVDQKQRKRRTGEEGSEQKKKKQKAGIQATATTIVVPNVLIMALEGRFEVRNEVEMLPSFRKCFPNIETLHVQSEKADVPTGKINLKFWQEAGPIHFVQAVHIKEMVLHEFNGSRSKLAFLKFIAERAQVLEEMVIVVAHERFSSGDDLNIKLKSLTNAKWANKTASLGSSRAQLLKKSVRFIVSERRRVFRILTLLA
ncbi:hypothetical protein BAE44_0014456 [Dichanthelium oligosanthes]|uniref:Uncharacterized protein n=1 Tax=Dichanthelium oligosanthes TaxID=888268 RepID=A0A1E5VHJ8_9POAL|nr:hypothetical protein BAE44_0014456 [Dichanthelium oligosanthes]